MSRHSKLGSEQIGTFYIDKYRFESDPTLLGTLVDELLKLLPSSFDRLAGLKLGSIPLDTVLSLRTCKPCLYVHKKAKSYGTCNLVEEDFKKEERAVIIEDVYTTTGQVCNSIQQMRKWV